MSGFNGIYDRSPAGSYEEPSFMAMMTAKQPSTPIVGDGPKGDAMFGGGSFGAMPIFNVKDVSSKNNQIFKNNYAERPECLISFRESGVKSHPFVISHSNLTFDQIPYVTGVPIKRQFYPPRRHLAPSNFETSSDWSHIEATMKGFFDSKGIRYSLPLTIAVFSVHGIPADPELVFDVYCCPNDITSTFNIEFRRNRGNAFVLSRLFFELKAILGLDDGNFGGNTSGSESIGDADSSTGLYSHLWNINIDLGFYDQNHKWVNLDLDHGALYRKDKKQLIFQNLTDEVEAKCTMAAFPTDIIEIILDPNIFLRTASSTRGDRMVYASEHFSFDSLIE